MYKQEYWSRYNGVGMHFNFIIDLTTYLCEMELQVDKYLCTLYLFCGSPSRSPHYALHPIYRKPWQSLSVTRDFNLRILHPGIPAKFSNPIILGLAQSNPWIAGWKNFITSDKWVTINSWNSVIGLYNLQMWPSVIVCQELLTFSAICLYKQVHSVNLMVGYAACTVAAK